MRRKLVVNLVLKDKLTVGFTGHIYPGRGAELLFELAGRMPDVNFLWVGGTPDEVAYWREQLIGSGATNVTMTGFVENSRLPLYQAAADIIADAVRTLDLGFQRSGYC